MDTAGAAKFDKNKEKGISTIASQLASKIYGLKILIKNFRISDNITRFLVFAPK